MEVSLHIIYEKHWLPLLFEGRKALDSFGFCKRNVDNELNNINGTPYQPNLVPRNCKGALTRMRVLRRTSKGYKQDPTKHFDFIRFANQCSNFVLIEAAFEDADKWEQFDLNDAELAEIKKNRIVRLEFEEPNKFFLGDNMDAYDEQFHRIFTICPYTSEWLNNKHNTNKRFPIFFPFNEEDIPSPSVKRFDIIYTGHIVSSKLLKDIVTMTKFNYRFVSNSKHQLVTNQKAGYSDKLRLISESKITLVHNLLYPKRAHIKNVWKYDGWQNNKAFSLIPRPNQFWRRMTDRNVVVPQLKSRVFEAAFCRSLILCKWDQFNVIERYFQPDKEFVYFSKGNLEKKVSEILTNYGNYEQIIERAYERAVNNYTTEKFVENYLKKI